MYTYPAPLSSTVICEFPVTSQNPEPGGTGALDALPGREPAAWRAEGGGKSPRSTRPIPGRTPSIRELASDGQSRRACGGGGEPVGRRGGNRLEPRPCQDSMKARVQGAKKKPGESLSGVGAHRASTAGVYLTPRCGVPVRAPSARQPHQTP